MVVLHWIKSFKQKNCTMKTVFKEVRPGILALWDGVQRPWGHGVWFEGSSFCFLCFFPRLLLYCEDNTILLKFPLVPLSNPLPYLTLTLLNSSLFVFFFPQRTETLPKNKQTSPSLKPPLTSIYFISRFNKYLEFIY